VSAGITITVNELGKRFNREWIFRKLNFCFSPAGIYAITGANGSGKSTLLQVLTGHIPPSSGSIIYQEGNKIIDEDQVFRKISIAAPYIDLIEEFTLLEHLEFHFRLKKIRQNITIADLMQIMYLDNAQNKPIGNFSSGMKQRLKLAIAFYTQAAVLFLDEPGTNLDSNAFDWYLKELAKVPPGGAVFIASNNPAEYPENSKILDIHNFKN
jgi:ABC-type multidrug transport system ATPase subunit